MGLARIQEWLLPGAAEADEGFRQEVLSLAGRSIKVLAGVELAASAVLSFGLPLLPIPVILFVVGCLTAAIAMFSGAYAHFRWIGAVSAAVATFVAASGISAATHPDYVLGSVTVLVLSAAASLPLLPTHGLAIGLAGLAGGFNGPHRVFLVMLALVATAIVAMLYSQRRANYEAYVGVLRATEEFRSLQSRLLLAENSATMVRLSAALAHELSQPVATVTSALDTLLMVCARHAGAPPSEHERLIALERDLGRSLKEGMERLRKMVSRIQRLNDLDESGLRNANVNELLNEAVELVKQQAPAQTQFNLDLAPVPEIQCRPQQLIAVFSTILTNSVEATSTFGRIAVSSRQSGPRLEVVFEDNGRGIPAERLRTIFDPTFHVADGRVSTVNWSLFTSRQFIKDHGGDMRIHSQPGQGTTVSLTLPCSS